jgi:hypothetical protein
MDNPALYKSLIDKLVNACREGQGRIGPNRAISGVWNKNATETFIPEQHRMNLLLLRLSDAERVVLAEMLSNSFQAGVFETLKVLETAKIKPFEIGYEGSPFEDFIGRINDWEWPS